jgi:hypothetical protein
VLTVATDGWPAVRAAIFERDGGCVATQFRVFGKDIAPDQCRDGYGDPCEYDDFAIMEAEHVKEQIGGFRASDDEAHLVTACPWHHRLSQRFRVDSKAHRVATRAWLAQHYPGVWNGLQSTTGPV